MKITRLSDHEMIIASHENLWMLLLLPLIVTGLGLCFLESGFDLIGLGVSATVFFAWFVFSYFASDTVIILDKYKDEFNYMSTQFFGAREEFKCALSKISDVVIEREVGDEGDSYRIGFVIESDTKYPSKIFRGGSRKSVEKAYMDIRKHIFDEALELGSAIY